MNMKKGATHEVCREDIKHQLRDMNTLLELVVPMIKKYQLENGVPATKVIECLPPKDLVESMSMPLSTGYAEDSNGLEIEDISKLLEKVLKYSVRTCKYYALLCVVGKKTS